MIIKMDFDTIKCNQAKGVKIKQGDKQITPYLVLYADESNIDEAVEWSRGNKQVALLYFVGDNEILASKDVSNSKVAIKLLPDIIDDKFISNLAEIPQNVRIICKLPEGYSNMRQIYTLSQLYSNIRFCGGNLISLLHCKLGCISAEDLGRKGKQGLQISDCFAVEKPVDIDRATQEIIFEKIAVSPSATKSESKSKSKSTKTVLPSFATLGGIDSF